MRVAAALAVVAVLAGGCGDDTADVERPPLGSPPFAGEVPSSDDLDPDRRDEIAASTVFISGIACGRMSEGSGFAVADDLVATNAHVVAGVDEIRVDLLDGRRLPATPVAFDADDDLAILRVDGAELVPLTLGDAADGTVGALMAWEGPGEPDPTPFRIDRPITVRIESVGSVERIERPSWLIAADVESGDSGAALVDDAGVVVGISYAATTRDEGVAYAVRASELTELIAAGIKPTARLPGC